MRDLGRWFALLGYGLYLVVVGFIRRLRRRSEWQDFPPPYRNGDKR